MEAIESEVKKLIDSDFIRKEQYSDWVTNIVPVLKKNEKIQICIDYCGAPIRRVRGRHCDVHTQSDGTILSINTTQYRDQSAKIRGVIHSNTK